VNALWIDGLRAAARIATATGHSPDRFDALARRAAESFERRFARAGGGWLDLIDGAGEGQLRPNQIVAEAVLGGRGAPPDAVNVLAAVEPLRTSIGLRSLAPSDPDYLGRHRGAPAERDAAYHQGTVWPWLLGPLVDVLIVGGDREGAAMVVDDALPHLLEWGLGSVSETADGDAPHDATGCPFQAWSVAEWLRAARSARVRPRVPADAGGLA
jgi:glycogen debranching enzyme